MASNKTKHLLVENELKKPKEFDASHFRRTNYFVGDHGIQIYLAFQPMCRYFKKIAGVGNSDYISSWKSKGLSNKKMNSITTSDYSITSKLSHYGSKARVEFNGGCLKQDKVTYNHGTIVNIYIVYEINKNCNISCYPTLENGLFN